MRPIGIDGVPWSVCLSVTLVSCAKSAEPIEMLFGLWTQLVGSRSHVLVTRIWAILKAKGGGPGHSRTCSSVDIRLSSVRSGLNVVTVLQVFL